MQQPFIIIFNGAGNTRRKKRFLHDQKRRCKWFFTEGVRHGNCPSAILFFYGWTNGVKKRKIFSPPLKKKVMAQRRQALFVQGLDAEGISKEGGIRKLVYKTSCATRGIYNKNDWNKNSPLPSICDKSQFQKLSMRLMCYWTKKKHRCEITLEFEPDSKL